MLLAATLVELMVVVFVWRFKTPISAGALTLAFIVPASLYRLAGHLLGQPHCPCLGYPSGWWPWLAANETAVVNTLAAWLFLSSSMMLCLPALRDSGRRLLQ